MCIVSTSLIPPPPELDGARGLRSLCLIRSQALALLSREAVRSGVLDGTPPQCAVTMAVTIPHTAERCLRCGLQHRLSRTRPIVNVDVSREV